MSRLIVPLPDRLGDGGVLCRARDPWAGLSGSSCYQRQSDGRRCWCWTGEGLRHRKEQLVAPDVSEQPGPQQPAISLWWEGTTCVIIRIRHQHEGRRWWWWCLLPWHPSVNNFSYLHESELPVRGRDAFSREEFTSSSSITSKLLQNHEFICRTLVVTAVTLLPTLD